MITYWGQDITVLQNADSVSESSIIEIDSRKSRIKRIVARFPNMYSMRLIDHSFSTSQNSIRKKTSTEMISSRPTHMLSASITFALAGSSGFDGVESVVISLVSSTFP